MNRKEITNSQDYKATEAALKWWYSLPEEQRRLLILMQNQTSLMLILMVFSMVGTIPNWISVEERLPEVGEKVIFYSPGIDDWLSGAFQQDGTWWNEEYGTHFYGVTHWMPIVPPRKEEKE